MKAFFPNDTREVRVERNLECLSDRYKNYLVDESKMKAPSMAAIVFPEDSGQLSWILQENFRAGLPTRISGARTGIAGGAVPNTEDVVISLERLKHIGPITKDERMGIYSISVGAGVTLQELNEHLLNQPERVFFPVDPTETWAALGGMVSTNASGARTYHYGPMRDWVLGLRVVLADGAELHLTRGEETIVDGRVVLEVGASKRELVLENIPKPKTKATLGYHFSSGQDVIDLFIGSEGTLGVFSEILLRLEPIPAGRLYYLQFFSDDETALEYVSRVRDQQELRVLAIEYLDKPSLDCVRQSPLGRQTAPGRMLHDGMGAAVYLEVIFDGEDDFSSIYEVLTNSLPEGANPEASFAGTEDKELREIKAFRHAVPEHINSVIAKRKADIPELHKVATDMAVPNAYLREIFFFYKNCLVKAGLEYAIFGHAGNNHFHVNILPRSRAELEQAKSLYYQFAEKVLACEGALASEHGIGRLKRAFLRRQYPLEVVERMRKLKKFFDPQLLLNRGVLFEDAPAE